MIQSKIVLTVWGISNLKWSGVAKLQDLHSFKLHPQLRIMFSIAKQVFRGTALTQKQIRTCKKFTCRILC